jgi:hypothetical protein
VEISLKIKAAISFVKADGLCSKDWTYVFFFNYSDNCSVGDEGCEYISRGKWPKINWIQLGLLIIIEMVIGELL